MGSAEGAARRRERGGFAHVKEPLRLGAKVHQGLGVGHVLLLQRQQRAVAEGACGRGGAGRLRAAPEAFSMLSAAVQGPQFVPAASGSRTTKLSLQQLFCRQSTCNPQLLLFSAPRAHIGPVGPPQTSRSQTSGNSQSPSVLVSPGALFTAMSYLGAADAIVTILARGLVRLVHF